MQNLHITAIWICAAITFCVFSVLIFSLIRFRKLNSAKTNHFHEHLLTELLWTTAPFIMLVALALPATQSLQQHNDAKRKSIIPQQAQLIYNDALLTNIEQANGTISSPTTQLSLRL